MKIQELYHIFSNSSGVCTDSRKIEKDSIFFALKGANYNGNFFAEQAIEEGCSYAVIDDIEFKKNEQTVKDCHISFLLYMAFNSCSVYFFTFQISWVEWGF